jgi:imidazolonepropionase-like amidohydrolase
MLGHPEHLQLQRAIIDENRLAPRLVTSGPSFNGNSVSNPAQAGTMVAEQAVLGYDFLKIHPGLSRAEYDAMAEAAHERNIDFAGHVPSQVGLAHALNRGQLTIDHLDGLLQALIPDLENEVGSDEGFFGVNLVHRVDARRIPELVDMIKQSGAWMVPTETLFENFAAAASPAELLARPEIVYLPPDLMSGYERALAGAATATDDMSRYLAVRKQLLRARHTAGVGLLLGSDSPQVFNVPGYSIHRELQSMVAAGLPPLAALRMGTTNPALFLGRAEDFGALVAGQSADLVILGSNPLESISNSLDIRGVMLRGRWVDAEERAARLADIAKRYATAE